MVNWRHVVHKITDKPLRIFKNAGISPNRISWISLLLSAIASLLFRSSNSIFGIITLFLVLLLDTMDGFLARQRKMASFDGLIVDVSCDRLSEFIMFYPSVFWISLATANTLITVFRLKDKKIYILPLRHIFLILSVVKLFVQLPIGLYPF